MPKEKQSTKQLAWYPTRQQKTKIEQLKTKLFLRKNSDLIHRAIGELYEKTFPNDSLDA